MNDKRRKILKKATEKIKDAIVDIEFVKDEEQDAYDNLPENFQMSDKGEQMQEYVYMLDEAIDSLNDALEDFEDAIENMI